MGAFLLRVFEHFVGRSRFTELTVRQKKNSIGVVVSEPHFVRDQQHGPPLFCKVANDAQDFTKQFGIE